MPETPFGTAPSRALLITAFAAVYVVWGSTYLAIRIAIQTLPPLLMAGTRFLTAGAILYAWSRAKGAPRPTSRQWMSTGLIGALLCMVSNGSVCTAEQMVPSGLAALIVALVPLWMMLLRWAM